MYSIYDYRILFRSTDSRLAMTHTNDDAIIENFQLKNIQLIAMRICCAHKIS